MVTLNIRMGKYSVIISLTDWVLVLSITETADLMAFSQGLRKTTQKCPVRESYLGEVQEFELTGSPW